MALEIKLTSKDDAPLVASFYQENEKHLQPWVPQREKGFHTVSAWAERLVEYEKQHLAETAAHFIGFIPESNEIVGTCSLTNIARGFFQACHMGYAIAEKHQGRGYMKQICQHSIDHAFSHLGLHRIMANYMPSNERSAGLLRSLGFVREGYAERYLCINGRWEDHILTSLINPNNK